MNINYFLFLICISFCVFMFIYFKWYIKRRTSVLDQLEKYRTEVYKFKADINAVTERDSQLIEDRIKKLRAILDETDKRISVYVKELEKSRTGEALYTSLRRGIRAAVNTDQPQPQLSAIRPNIEVQPQLFSSEKAPRAQPLQVIPAQASSAHTAAAQSGAQAQKSSSKRQIRASIDLLANEGLPPAEIASRLDIDIAAVDLAMKLRRKRKS
jgi:hypothetical protein